MAEITQEERQQIIDSAKKAALDTISANAKTIDELEPANAAKDSMKIEVNGGKSITVSQLKEHIEAETGPFWED